MAPRRPDRTDKRDQSERRETVDRAERAEETQIVDPKAGARNRGHQHDPNPAETAMPGRPFRRSELRDPQPKRRQRRDGMDGDQWAGLPERHQGHVAQSMCD